MREQAMRLVCGKHIIRELIKPGTFFWLLCDGRPDNGKLLINTVSRVLEEWTPPQLDNLTDDLISSWIDTLKVKCIVALYKEMSQ